MLRETCHRRQREGCWGVPDGAGRDELDEARYQAALAYERSHLRHHLAKGGKPIILPAGPGAVLGFIHLTTRGVEVVARTFVPSWHLRPEQREACRQIRYALRCSCPRRQAQAFAAARLGARHWPY